ncbi:MAG: 23S rRNA (uracil(1939)-C(5))-methyltransferase RlmD [Ferruginibacter sp.]
MGKRNKKTILNDILVTGYAAEGKALAKIDGKVIFIEGAVPGDTVNILVTKNKKDWAEGRALEVVKFSAERVEPFCKHFGVCGGCKWQMLPYYKQLEYKQQEAEQNIRRIGKQEDVMILQIAGAVEIKHYRNKLEFTASNKEYMTKPLHSPGENKDGGNAAENNFLDNENFNEAILAGENVDFVAEETSPIAPVEARRALGFHVPRIFDKVIDIYECHLMDDVNNLIRNTVRTFAHENQFDFYDIRQHTGWLRNIIIRNCSTGQLMVNVVVNYDEPASIKMLLDHLMKEVPQISTLLYTINPKWNDSIFDLEPVTYFGKGYVTERLGELEFIISPKSFFQTNTKQAEKLYNITGEFAGLSGNEVLYDLYCGTGSIGIFLSKKAKKIIGVELIEQAIEDAKKNAALNNINHAYFFAGDVIKICDDAFFETQGRPDVVITDPPRAGMHEKLVNKLLEIAAPKIVYVSCNTATQARDIALLSEKYRLEKIQPVDMFPHTHHIESVALLLLKG